MMLLIGTIIWLQAGGWKMLRALRLVRRIRFATDPLAARVGTTVEQSWEDDTWVLRYKFADGNFLVVLVSEYGATTWTPQWNPGFEKATEGLSTLQNAIDSAASKRCSNGIQIG